MKRDSNSGDMHHTQQPDKQNSNAAHADDGLIVQLQACRRAWLAHKPEVEQRRRLLAAFSDCLSDYAPRLVAAMSADFGHRPFAESMLGDVLQVQEEIRFTRSRLRAWSKRQPVPVDWKYWPGQAWLQYRPLGVVGVVSAWNYPLTVGLTPLVSVLAAGNHAMYKPSEFNPATNEVLAEMFAELFTPDQVALVTGGPEVAAAFTALPFDHLIFTGSTDIGRKVMAAAAENLPPVTLELGGKSPAVITSEDHFDDAIKAIVSGKFFNAGQTCIAPDYVMVPAGSGETFVRQLQQAADAAYPQANRGDAWTSIITERHYQRLQQLVTEAESGGGKVSALFTAASDDAEHRRMAPVAVLNPDADARLLQEEIFGPVLPVLEMDDLETAMRYINARPRPLSLYLFSHDQAEQERILAGVSAGGFCINDTLLHMAQLELPFGGVGASGMGSYHGWHGFRTFSQAQPVYRQSKLSASRLFKPPFHGWKQRLIKLLAR
jgi:coniferyl-aldehyde dehydrogenase